MHQFDIIVVGGGHAGVEAAAVAARMGAQVALVSFDPGTIGAMSCNPAIGGLGKGHLVREVDALDGLIGRAADAAAIHYRMLNRSKGSAVQGPRVQADRKRFKAAIQTMIAAQAGLTVVAGEAAALSLRGERVVGIELGDGTALAAQAVILCTGTFLGGRLFRGEERLEGGRIGEASAHRLAAQLRDAALPMARLKTGTPPRLDGRTIDWAALAEQPSDTDPWTMSPLTRGRSLPQVFCAITRTNERTHDLIREGLDRSPLFSGAIGAAGPRYCPSIEDKIQRFGDREGHQVFLEPEGLDDTTVYPNGVSTSLPTDVQWAMMRSMAGLERVEIVVPGYAVEYDHIDPRALRRSLELRGLPGLYCAGQINGTTGYEEAAGQGIVAGLNAALAAGGADPIVFDRADGYLGVMIDDLVTRGITEPYRMFTSRAEYRLTLRADNADQRLTDKGIALGCVGMARAERHRTKMTALDAAKTLAKSLAITPNEAAKHGLSLNRDGHRRSAFELLAYPEIEWPAVQAIWPELSAIDPAIAVHLEIDAKYDVYLKRQTADVDAFRRDEGLVLTDVDYADVPGLSNEARAKLQKAQPRTVGQAGRIDGMTPAALGILAAYLRREARRKSAKVSA